MVIRCTIKRLSHCVPVVPSLSPHGSLLGRQAALSRTLSNAARRLLAVYGFFEPFRTFLTAFAGSFSKLKAYAHNASGGISSGDPAAGLSSAVRDVVERLSSRQSDVAVEC